MSSTSPDSPELVGGAGITLEASTRCCLVAEHLKTRLDQTFDTKHYSRLKSTENSMKFQLFFKKLRELRCAIGLPHLLKIHMVTHLLGFNSGGHKVSTREEILEKYFPSFKCDRLRGGMIPPPRKKCIVSPGTFKEGVCFYTFFVKVNI